MSICCACYRATAIFPIITPPGSSDAGEAINVDGDRAAAMVAAAFNAEALIILSNVPVLRNFPGRSLPHSRDSPHQGRRLYAVCRGPHEKEGHGRRRSAGEGVQKVIFADGRCEQPVTKAINGGGTQIA